MSNRRNFLKKTATFSSFLGLSFLGTSSFAKTEKSIKATGNPIVISTWNHGISANAAAWEILNKGGKAIDAVEAGVRIPESDPEIRSVGYGGYPDVEGNVTLDACIMDENQNCGSVAFLQNIKNPISVARLVMDNTPHVMLVGEGALQFAVENGFKKESLLTPETLKEWRKMNKIDKQEINVENHDTIGMVAIDQNGNLSGACTTSGAANKMYGRVGDSPIIGAGLFVDNNVGGACATGWGEEVIKQAGTAMVVELMRHGRSPEEACREVTHRVLQIHNNDVDFQIGFLALRKDGEYGAFAIKPGFNYAVQDASKSELIDSEFYKG